MTSAKVLRPEQFWFTPVKSTTDRIPTLHVFVEHRLRFRHGVLTAHFDLKKAFDLVHREALWDVHLSVGFLEGLLTWWLTLLGIERALKHVCRGLRLLPRYLRSAPGIRLCSITFQHLHGLCIKQSCWSKSFPSICWQDQGHWPCFCCWHCTSHGMTCFSSEDSQSAAWRGEATAAEGLLGKPMHGLIV